MGLKNWIVKKAIGWAKPSIKEAVSVENVAGIMCGGIDWAAKKTLNKVSDERLTECAQGCTVAAGVFAAVAEAVQPFSENGREMGPEERENIRAQLTTAVELIVTQEELDKIVDALLDHVIEKLG